MARKIVQGDQFLLEAWKVDAWYPFACATGVKLTRTNEYDSTVTPDSGPFRTKAPTGLSDLAIDFSGVTVLRDEVNTIWAGWEFMTNQMVAGVNLRLTTKDEAGFFKQFTGFFYPQSVSMEGVAGDTGNDTIQFIYGGGPVGIGDGGIDPPVNTQLVKRIQFVVTDTLNYVQDDLLKGLSKDKILEVSRENDNLYKPIDAGIPDNRQVVLNPIGGTLTFLVPLGGDEDVYALVSLI